MNEIVTAMVNEAYRPTFGSTPAMIENEIASGIRARATTEQGLIAPEARTEGGFRLYTDDQVQRLVLIKQMKPLGFTVAEMRGLLRARETLSATTATDDDRAEAAELLTAFSASAVTRCDDLREQLDRAEAFARALREQIEPAHRR